jgi:hypothetical protein
VLLFLVSLCFAETNWTTGATTGTRWPDVAAVSLTLAAGDEVEVVLRDGDKVRVRKGSDFGWVASGALTSQEPPPPIDLSSLGLPSPTDLPELPGP